MRSKYTKENPQGSLQSRPKMDQMTIRGTLKGHNGWVTQIATTPQDPNAILSASRGLQATFLWSLTC